ncbi:MAG: 50S ribosomal protein L4 [Planctomycetales bacterium]|nr:50S ribosomal protein L4 [Planctomycetales bacterium]
MTTLPVFDRTGKEVGSYEIDLNAIAPKISKQLMHDAVVMYQANRRMGTHKSKTRSEVAGSTKKMYRQKGTGNARAGSRRSGVRRGGGHIHAKRPRDYSYSLPRKALQVATRMAIASKIQDGQLVVIDELSLAAPKTKEMATILSALQLGAESTLVATCGHDANVYKSARNIAGVSVAPVAELNALSVLAPSRLLVTKAALDDIRDRAAAARAN